MTKKQNKQAVQQALNTKTKINDAIKIILDKYDVIWFEDQSRVDGERMSDTDYHVYNLLFDAKDSLAFVRNYVAECQNSVDFG